jgi:hypothetical protein
MHLIDIAFALLLSLLAIVTGGCGNHRLYVGVEQYDTVREERVTNERGWWERIAGGYGQGGGKSISGE